MKWSDSIPESMDMNLSKFWELGEDRGTWCAAVHEVAKSWTQLSDWTTRLGTTFIPNPIHLLMVFKVGFLAKQS